MPAVVTRFALTLAASLLACSSPKGEPRPIDRSPTVITTPVPADASARRCLPVVSSACGCVYDCGVGALRADGGYDVTQPFWGDSVLDGRVSAWCVDGQCTDAFDVELPCSIICAPKPADATCGFDAQGRCHGAAMSR